MNSGGVEVSAIEVEKMPSEYNATAGSVPTAFVRRPTPRIARRSSLRYETLGVKRARSSTVLTPSKVRVSLVYADTATGTSWMLTARFSAVTTTSSSTDVRVRSEEHTSELQSQSNLVCRLLLEK